MSIKLLRHSSSYKVNNNLYLNSSLWLKIGKKYKREVILEKSQSTNEESAYPSIYDDPDYYDQLKRISKNKIIIILLSIILFLYIVLVILFFSFKVNRMNALLFNKYPETIEFGEYPQTRVEDEDLIKEIGKVKEKNSQGYYEYKGEQYALIFKRIENPFYYNYPNYYCYKVEPIVWRVLEGKDGKVLIVSDMIIDAHRYNKRFDERNEQGYYANHYQSSEIRAWLNDDFINSAFSDQSRILTTELDVSWRSTGNNNNTYAYPTTYDKVFLLNKDEYQNENYFSSDEDRRAKATDYAVGKGLSRYEKKEYKDNACYWTLSPYTVYSDRVYFVGYSGYISYASVGYENNGGVRPAMWIIL